MMLDAFGLPFLKKKIISKAFPGIGVWKKKPFCCFGAKQCQLQICTPGGMVLVHPEQVFQRKTNSDEVVLSWRLDRASDLEGEIWLPEAFSSQFFLLLKQCIGVRDRPGWA